MVVLFRAVAKQNPAANDDSCRIVLENMNMVRNLNLTTLFPKECACMHYTWNQAMEVAPS